MNNTNQGLIGDHARNMARALVNLIAHNYRDEELRDLWEEVSRVCKAGIEAFDIERRRIAASVNFSEN